MPGFIFNQPPDSEIVLHEADVDLKYALWSADPSYWEDYAPGVYGMMEDLQGTLDLLIINTAPRKEIRYGRVEINVMEDGQWAARGTFHTEWDDVYDLLDTFGLPDSKELWLMERLPAPRDFVIGMHDYPAGVAIQFSVFANTLDELLDAVDTQEERLIELDESEYTRLHNQLGLN
jgi:hypothetical protein